MTEVRVVDVEMAVGRVAGMKREAEQPFLAAAREQRGRVVALRRAGGKV